MRSISTVCSLVISCGFERRSIRLSARPNKNIRANVRLWRRASLTFTVNRQVSQVIMARSCLPLWCAAENHTTMNSEWYRRQGRQRISWKGNIKEWTGQSMSSLLRIADDRSRWVAITAEASIGVTQRRLGVTGIGWLVKTIWLKSFTNTLRTPSNKSPRKPSLLSD